MAAGFHGINCKTDRICPNLHPLSLHRPLLARTKAHCRPKNIVFPKSQGSFSIAQILSQFKRLLMIALRTLACFFHLGIYLLSIFCLLTLWTFSDLSDLPFEVCTDRTVKYGQLQGLIHEKLVHFDVFLQKDIK